MNIKVQNYLYALINQSTYSTEFDSLSSFNKKEIRYLFNFVQKNNIANIFLKKSNLNCNINDTSELINQSTRFKIQHLQIMKEIKMLNRFSKEIGIDFIFLKGIPIAYSYYDDINDRPMLDVDILIDRHDIYKAYRHLKSKGYNFHKTKIRDFDHKTLNKYLEGSHHLPSLVLKNNNVSIELHHRVTLKKDFEHCPLTDSIIKNKKSLDIFEESIYIPSINDLICHLVTNYSFNNEFTNNFIAINDLVNIKKKERLDFSKIIEQAKNKKIKKAMLLIFTFIDRAILKENIFKNEFVDNDIDAYIKTLEATIFKIKTNDFSQIDKALISDKRYFEILKKKILLSETEIRNKYEFYDDNYLKLIYLYLLNLSKLIKNRSRNIFLIKFRKKKEKNFSKNFIDLNKWINS